MSFLQAIAHKTARFLGHDSWIIRHLRPTYENLLDWSTQGEGIGWTINGVTYRIDPHYRHMLAPHYDSAVAEFLRQRVKPGAVCFDVGANVGVYVLQFCYWAGTTGKVIAFEPNPEAVAVLEKHIQINKITPYTTVIKAAIGATNGEATLYIDGPDAMSRLGVANHLMATRAKPITVPLITLDTFCLQQGMWPDWLFIDIEGFEIAALQGAQQLIKRRRPDLGIIVEMHPDVWDSANTTRAQTTELLQKMGLQVVPLTGQKDPLAEHGLVHLAYI
jgi:FkbM family methyltransferase